MDWYKVKNILIFVLIMLNIGLYSVFYRTDTQDKIIKRQTQDNVVSLLASNNIHIDKKIIPTNTEYLTGRYIERALETNTLFIAKLLDTDYKTLENGSYSSKDKKLTFSGNMLDYTDKNPTNPPNDFSEETITRYCFDEMKRLDINYKIYNYNGLNFIGNNVKAIFSPSIGEYEFFDSFISFEISQNGITAMQGKNILIAKTVPSIQTKVFDINSVLLGLSTHPSTAGTQITGIISINLGFYIGSGEERYSNVLAIPAWQIATENGSIFYFDARNGKYIE